MSMWAALILLLVASGWYLHAEGRPWWCACGELWLTSWKVKSQHNSQHFIDPYSFTHVLHGVLLYGLFAWLLARYSRQFRLWLTLLIELVWELIENSQFIIDRYRTTTIALGYEGDSILNSAGDLVTCAIGFALARWLGFRGSLIVCLATEVILLITIRDSLLLSTLSLIHPIEAINAWQTGQ
jgi:hypothetical protein